MVTLIAKDCMQKRGDSFFIVTFLMCFILHKNDILISVTLEYTLGILNFSVRAVCLKCL